MKKSAPFLLAVGLVAGWFASSGTAQEEPAAPKLETSLQRISYAMGYRLGKTFGDDLDVELLQRGLADARAGRADPLDEKQLQNDMNEYGRAKAEKEAKEAKAKGDAFLAKNKGREGVTTLPSGLQYEVMKQGDGPSPAATDEVTVHYHGTLIDGTVFDSSVDRGQPATFPLNRVIKGWTEGLQLMKTGGKWKFFIPSELAYGPQRRSEKIGPNEVLVFEVELLSIKGK
jgi:FKBP-type peptidyl-prolyl cis-trans isomerase FklB